MIHSELSTIDTKNEPPRPLNVPQFRDCIEITGDCESELRASVEKSGGKHTMLGMPPSKVTKEPSTAIHGDLKRRRLHPKCVHFKSNIVDASHANPYSLSEDLEETLWWSGKQTQRKAKMVASEIQRVLDDRKQNSRLAEDSKSNAPILYLDWIKRHIVNSSESSESQKLPHLSISSPIRGLESYLVPERAEFKRKTLFRILAAQKKLPPKATSDQKAALMRAVSRSLTQSSRQLAKMLAVQDAKAVADNAAS